jgi:PAS domain S-box-containing protein
LAYGSDFAGEDMILNRVLKILLVEDSESDAALLQENIRLSNRDDLHIDVARSLREATDFLQNNHVDATLLDLTLPDSFGLETVHQIKRADSDMPIVVLTGVDDENTGVEAVRMGAQDYLVKGKADGRLITRAVRYAIERKKMEAELRKARDELEMRVQERTRTIRQQSMFLEAYFQHSLTPVVFLDRRFNFIRANEAYARACQRQVEDFPGHNHFEFYPHAENQAIFETVVRTKAPHIATAKAFIFPDHPEWGVTCWDWTLVPILDSIGEVELLIYSLQDVTQRKRTEMRTHITNRLLALFIQKNSRKEYLDSVVQAIHDWSGCDCVGIRLTNSEGLVPFESCIGYSKAFLSLENALCLKSDACACIRAISQTPEPQDAPLLTSTGSFRSNNSIEFVKSLPGKAKKRYRANCMRFGFASIAVIPIRYRDEILGAIHLADRQENKMPAETVEFIENMAMLIGEAVHRFNTETELRESEERYRQLVELSPDGISVEMDGKILFINTAGANLLGYKEPQQLIGKPIFDFVHPDHRRRSRRALEYLRRKDKSLPLREETFLDANGASLDVEVAATPLIYQNKPSTQIVFRDITERKLAQERILADQAALRSLTSELQLAEERERRRIASDLHDSIGQILALSKWEVVRLEKSAPAKMAASLKAVANQLDMAVKQARTLSFELSPSVLYDLGFEVALEELAERFSKEREITCLFKNNGGRKPLPDAIKVLLYRSVRELLINVAKHANAKVARILLERTDTELYVTVEDDGDGFDPSVLNAPSRRPRGFGVMSIRERLRHIGGRFEIQSRDGRGTKVTLVAPTGPLGEHKTERIMS